MIFERRWWKCHKRVTNNKLWYSSFLVFVQSPSERSKVDGTAKEKEGGEGELKKER